MDILLKDLPQWILIAGILATGIIAGFGVFDARARARRKDENEIEDRVIKLLKEQNDELTKKIENYELKFTQIDTKVRRIEAQNQLMKEILQGSDKDSMEYRKRGTKAMEQITELGKISAENGRKAKAIIEAVKGTNRNIERLAKAIEKHLAAELKISQHVDSDRKNS